MRLPPLNEAQLQAVQHGPGPMLVLAGAGSGKTRVLTCRIAYLTGVAGVSPHRILAVTFTNKAAQEMKRRVGTLLGGDPAGLWIGTFHSICARVLRREAHHIGFQRNFSIYDESDRLGVIKRLLERHGKSVKFFRPRTIQSIISNAKNRLITPEQLEAEAADEFTHTAALIYRDLVETLKDANAMDFDDLLLHPLELFTREPGRLEYYQNRFDYILVDEFQDTNRAQYLLVRDMALKHECLCIVGDDDQSIYGWRGAQARNLLDFKHDFPETCVIRLEENYRSTRFILEAANSVIEGNRDRLGKTLYTKRDGGEPVIVTTCADERDEAEWIIREIKANQSNDHYLPGEIAILYRTNSQSRALEDALRKQSVPYRVVGSVSFYARKEIRDLIAYLKLVVNAKDDEAFIRAIQVPRRGIGQGSINLLAQTARTWNKSLLQVAEVADRVNGMRPRARNALRDFAVLINRLRAEHDSSHPERVLERLIQEIDYEGYLRDSGPGDIERMENVRELITAVAEWKAEEDEPGGLEGFLTSSSLITSQEMTEGDEDGITLMTVHTAKGLEWPVVYVAGMEDGLFPLARSVEGPEGIEEERRLAYVAITRAADRLYITWARARRRGAQMMPGRPSRFLEALPPDTIEERRTTGTFGFGKYHRTGFTGVPRPAPVSVEPEMESQDAPRYIKGERVRHGRFGSGTIRGLTGRGRDLKVLVEFDSDEVGTRQLLVAVAGLERDWDGT